jgi:mannose-1-phosphate guanylyltransferase
VEQFVEKPSAAVAQSYVDSGAYRWNAGMFVVRPRVLLDLLAQHHPDLAAALRAIAADPPRLPEVWPTLARISIDHAVAEPAAAVGRVAVVPADLGWDDIGDFASLSDVTGAGGAGDLEILGDPDAVVATDAGGIVVPQGGRLVAVLGLDDVVVVDTSDAVLVTTRERAQDVKGIVERLREMGRDDLT